MKIFWIILSVLLLIIIGTGVAGYLWWTSNQEELMIKMDQAVTQAKDIAPTTDSDGCVSATMQRLAECDRLTCGIADRIFLSECLVRAENAEGFCKDVPKPGNIVEVSTWSLAKCEGLSQQTQACVRVIAAIPEFCHA